MGIAFIKFSTFVAFIGGDGKIRKRPTIVTRPVVGGLPYVGSTLVASSGVWDANPAATFTYQWQIDGADIPGATDPSYLVDAADYGHDIRVVVAAANSLGSSASASLATTIIDVPLDAPKLDFSVNTNSQYLVWGL